jgi:hypothetical protein
VRIDHLDVDALGGKFIRDAQGRPIHAADRHLRSVVRLLILA